MERSTFNGQNAFPTTGENILVDNKPLRELNDEELRAALASFRQKLAQTDRTFFDAWQATCNLRCVMQCLSYEIERRAKSIRPASLT